MLIRIGQYLPLSPFIICSCLASVVQLVLGADLTIVIMAFFSLILSVLILNYRGFYNILSMFGFVLCLKYTVIPVFFKTLLLERIDEGLWAPFESFAMILFGYITLYLSIYLVDIIGVKEGYYQYTLNTKKLRMYGWTFFIIGYVCSILHVINKPEMYGYTVERGFGGFGLFIGLNYLGIIFYTFSYLIESNGKRAFGYVNIIMLILMFFEAMVGNTKAHFGTGLLGVVFSIIYYNKGFPFKYVLIGTLGSLLFVFILTPAIHYLRNPIFKTAKIDDKVMMVFEVLPKLFDPSTHIEVTDEVVTIANSLFNYFPNDILVDRIEMIQDMDLILSRIDTEPEMGFPLLAENLKKLLPSFLVEKNDFSEVDLISFYYATRLNGSAGFPTIGVFATNTAMFGYVGGTFFTFIIFAVYFFILRLLVNADLYKNLWGVFFMTELWLPFSERGGEALLVSIFRETFALAVVIFMVNYFVDFLFNKKISFA